MTVLVGETYVKSCMPVIVHTFALPFILKYSIRYYIVSRNGQMFISSSIILIVTEDDSVFSNNIYEFCTLHQIITPDILLFQLISS